jgi:dethiobiotin synthetase
MTNNPPGIFVTGTDTGVGKTLVSVALVRALVNHGLRVSAMKPIASGAEHTSGGLRNADALTLAEAINVSVPYGTLNPYCFEPAISPHIAAEEAKIEVDIGTIRARFDELSRGAEFVIVEGAGGWLAPISRTQSMADLVAALEIPVLLVVGLRLGCLNHAALTREAIEARGTPFAGWVANAIDPELQRPDENLATLERLLRSEPLAIFPFKPDSAVSSGCAERAARGLFTFGYSTKPASRRIP